ncbi:hypothetical protein LguiA_009417 [Lonicera macranthoides]
MALLPPPSLPPPSLPSSFTTINLFKDGKNNDKASATRSKHSVTEQRQRSKINARHDHEIPHSSNNQHVRHFQDASNGGGDADQA